jgi:hypothetical protein
MPTKKISELPAAASVTGATVVPVVQAGSTEQATLTQVGTSLAYVPKALVDAKGDIITATANDTPSRKAVGVNGETLIANSTDSDGLRWAKLSFALIRSGSYSSPSGTVAATTLTANRLFYIPYVVSRRIAFDRLAIWHNATVGGAGSVVRLGIYAAANDIPTDLIIDAGTVDMTSAAGALKAVTIATTIEPGLVFLAGVSQWVTTSPAIFAISNGAIRVPSVEQVAGSGYTQDSVTGTLPPTATPATAASSQPLLVYIRAA